MNNTSPRRQDVTRLREGAQWLVRLSERTSAAESLSDEELTALIRWYEMDPGNARVFEEMQALWDSLGQLDRAGLTAHCSAKPRLRDAGMRGMIGQLVESVATPLFSSRRKLLWSGLIASGTVSACAVIALMLARLPLLPADETMETTLAENQEAVLPDGSTVALGAQSSLVLEYAPAARHLKLTSGQAYFKVAKDKTRPFAVDTGDIKIRAVGTAFDVRKNDGRVAVTVTEGVVEIITDRPALETTNAANDDSSGTNASAPIRVAAGYQLIWDKGTDSRHGEGRKRTLQLSQVDTAGMTAWREGRLEYVNEPLSVVIANVNRYSSRPLVIEGADLRSLSFTGTILVDAIDDWLAAITVSFPVSVSTADDGSLIIRRRSGS